MTIKECIDIVDNLKPNQYSTEDKVDWLSFLDMKIINDVLKTHEGYHGEYDNFIGYSPDKLSAALIVPSPYDRLYTAYLKMRIDEENGETARYNNSATMFNSYMMEYKKWYNSMHMPLSVTSRQMPPNKPASLDVSKAQLEQLRKLLYAELHDDMLKEISDDKLYEIIKRFMDINSQMLKGKDGRDGVDGKDGVNGKDGLDGANGIGIRDAEVTSDGELKITLTSGVTMNLGVVKGAKGDRGERGMEGAKGNKGDRGEKGDKGDQGERGPMGPQGIQGANGEKGEAGVDGKDGKTAYQYAQDGGFDGTEEEFAILMAEAGKTEVDSELSKESTNPVQNKVLTKEVIILKEHNTQLKETIEKLQIKVTTEKASFHNIKDSANMKVVDFGMEGKTEQKTTEGKNLFDVDDFKACETLSVLSGGSYWGYKLNVVAGQTYTFNRNNSDGYDIEGLNSVSIYDGNSKRIVSFIDKWTESENKASVSFTATEETYLAFSTGNTVSQIQELFDTYFINPQLELGSVATPYEPHTNGPSPNPGFPQEIKNAGVYNEETGRYEHKFGFVNKNLWDAEYASDTNNWDSKSNIAYCGLPVYVGTGHKVTISYPLLAAGITGLFACVTLSNSYADDATREWIYHTNGGVLIDNDLTLTSINGYVYLWVLKDAVNTGIFMQYIGNDLQIEIADASTDYTPHQSTEFTLTSPVPLTKWDYLTKRDGVWGWSIWSEYLNINGDSGWVASNGNKGFYCECLPTNCSTQDAYCNQLINDPMRDNTVNGLWVGSGNKCVYARASAFFDNTLSDFGLVNWKTHLNENPLDIWYQTTEEQAFHPLPEEEQELLRNLEMYYGVTNMYNDQGCPTWLTYIADPKLYTDKKIAEQIAQTQALILEN